MKQIIVWWHEVWYYAITNGKQVFVDGCPVGFLKDISKNYEVIFMPEICES